MRVCFQCQSKRIRAKSAGVFMERPRDPADPMKLQGPRPRQVVDCVCKKCGHAWNDFAMDGESFSDAPRLAPLVAAFVATTLLLMSIILWLLVG